VRMGVPGLVDDVKLEKWVRRIGLVDGSRAKV
jgi:hypothetical protein